MPVSHHALMICFAILHHCLTVAVNKLHKHFDKNDVQLTKVPLLEGGTHLQRQGFEENVSAGGVHGDDVRPCFIVDRVHCFDSGALIFVCAHCVVGHIRHDGQKRRKSGWVCFGRAAQKSRFLVADAGSLHLCAQQIWKRSSIRDWRFGIPWIGSRACGSPAFMSAGEVSIIVDIMM
jgi:hypothetical protein